MSQDDPIDQLAILRAQLDQIAAMAPEIARTAQAWYLAFAGEGFNERQALYLAAVQLTQNPGSAPA